MRRHAPTYAIVLWVLGTLRIAAGEPDPVDQRDFSDSINGCAPATILNLLKFGPDGFQQVHEALVGGNDQVRMRYLVDRYFKDRPSATYPGQPRWGVHGIDCRDLVAGLNEMLREHGQPELNSRYLDREEAESEADHLLRCHELIADSLENGVPPILSIRTFVVKVREENGGEPAWEPGPHHYVLVTGVVGKPSAAGVELEIIDPWGGQRTVIYLHREPMGRSFRALKGTLDDGEWLDGRSFLQLLAPEVPSLRPKDLNWSERSVVVANFLAGRF